MSQAWRRRITGLPGRDGTGKAAAAPRSLICPAPEESVPVPPVPRAFPRGVLGYSVFVTPGPQAEAEGARPGLVHADRLTKEEALAERDRWAVKPLFWGEAVVVELRAVDE